MLPRLSSFAFAFRGILWMIKSQRNARFHLVATITVIAIGYWLGISHVEWGLILLTIAFVWCAEAFNTALEWLADAANPEPHPLVGKAKDVAACGVLIAAIMALIVGLLILAPKIKMLIQ